MSTAPMSAGDAPHAATASPPLRVWLPVAAVAAYWLVYAATGATEWSRYHIFLARFTALGVVLLTVLGWWLFHRGTPRLDKFLILAVAALTIVITLALRDASIYGPLMMAVVTRGLEVMLTCWAIWLAIARNASAPMRRRGTMLATVLAWAWVLAVRMEGLSGEATAEFYWRWTPTGEQQFLADASSGAVSSARTSDAEVSLVATDADWPEFRGPRRDGAVRDQKIPATWNEKAPKQLWKRRMGPGWSSIVIVGDRLFTQEQRRDQEAVVCFDADTGEPIWIHEDKARFDEAMGGDGPRATPTFADGRLFALGATGILNCLDAATGELHWSRDIKKDGQQSTPVWGFCSSPLVVEGRVIVFAGGGGSYGEADASEPSSDISATTAAETVNKQTLLAYDIATGDLAWRARSGSHSYSSPQLAEFDGQRQVLFVSDVAVEAVDPADGHSLWDLPANAKDGAPAIQAHLLDNDEFLAAFTGDSGLIRGRIQRDGDRWSVDVEWASRDLKPFFSDFVRVDGALYGFDGKYFCCVDAKTGKRRWRGGRYGSGQVLLIADEPALLVITEAGEAVLVAANPEKHEELGRFQAIEGKTWNHPTVCRGRLYVRNAEEMACYEL